MVLAPTEDDKNVDDSRCGNLFGFDGTMSFEEVGYQPIARPQMPGTETCCWRCKFVLISVSAC